jgi:hypothetical protein
MDRAAKTMSLPFLLKLPQDILRWVGTFFHQSRLENEKIFEFSWDWRSFMNTSKEHFHRWKKESQFITITPDHSRDFLTIAAFRERIINSVENSRNQLELQIGQETVIPSLQPDTLNLEGRTPLKRIV